MQKEMVMQAVASPVENSRKMLSAGRVLTGLVVLFMAFDGVTKVTRAPQVLKAMVELGFPDDLTRVLGVLVLACTVVYVIPRTSVLGAILLTAWLGGATAAKVRLEDHTMFFSVVIGVMVWGGLFFRDKRLRTLILLHD
jgi:DoxX-like family